MLDIKQIFPKVALFVAICFGCSSENIPDSSGMQTGGFSEKEATELSQNILTWTLDPQNYYESKSINSALNPDMYQLYEAGKLKDLFYSDEYWVDIVSSPSEISYVPSQGGGFHSYSIFILPKNNTEIYYVLTKFFDERSTGNYFLYKCQTDTLIKLHSALVKYYLDHDELYPLLRIDRIEVAKYSITYRPEFYVQLAEDESN